MRKPRLYFSMRSPYSWFAIMRLRESFESLDNTFDVYPYWDPDAQTDELLAEAGGKFHYVQMSRAKHLYMLIDTRRIAEGYGKSLQWPVDIDPFWELPHLAWLRARHNGHHWRLYDQLMQARWLHGQDICTPSVVESAAQAAHIDPGPLLTAHEDAAIRTEGAQCLKRAYLDDIFGIPYIKWGSQRYWGYDRVPVFLNDWYGSTPPPADVPVTPSLVEVDAPGGCG